MYHQFKNKTNMEKKVYVLLCEYVNDGEKTTEIKIYAIKNEALKEMKKLANNFNDIFLKRNKCTNFEENSESISVTVYDDDYNAYFEVDEKIIL